MENKFKFNKSIYTQIKNKQVDLILSTGANLYNCQEYDKAIEYYRLASSMGSATADSNLGYCYYYGHGVEKNYSIASAYWNLAAIYGDVNALYKLGDMYINGIYFEKDINLGLNYYLQAYSNAKDHGELENIPDVCFRLGKESLPGGLLEENIKLARTFLLIAIKGFEIRLTYDTNVQKLYDETIKMLDENNLLT